MNKSLWLVRLLSSHGKLSKQEILNAWSREDEHGRPMAPSTFYDNRRYLEERYNIHIICQQIRPASHSKIWITISFYNFIPISAFKEFNRHFKNLILEMSFNSI